MSEITVFTTLRAHFGVCKNLSHHIDRVLSHAAKLSAARKLPSPICLQEEVHVHAHRYEHARVKLMINKEGFKVVSEPFVFPDRNIYRGIKVHLSSLTIDQKLGQFKTLNRAPYELAMHEANTHGAFEALLLDQNGYLVDGSRTSPLLFKKGRLIKPLGGLEGITREEVIKAAQKIGIETHEEYLRPSELDGQLLLAGTGVGLVPVGFLSDAVVRRLVEQFSL